MIAIIYRIFSNSRNHIEEIRVCIFVRELNGMRNVIKY